MTLSERAMDDAAWAQLVDSGLLTTDEMLAARRRSEAVGGAVDTAILEHRALDSDDRRRLKQLLATRHGWPVASIALVNAPDHTALSLLPRALAEQHGLLAMAISAQHLTLASSGCPAKALSEIAFAIGRTPQVQFAFEAEIAMALSQHLDVPISERIQQLLDRGPGYLSDDNASSRLVDLSDAAPPMPPAAGSNEMPPAARSGERRVTLTADEIPAVSITASGRMRVITVPAPDDATLPDMPIIRPGDSVERAAAFDEATVLRAVSKVVEDAATDADLEIIASAGEAGIDALMPLFPGPLRVDRFTVEPRKVKAFGPVIEAVVRCGPRAGARLVALLDDLSPEVRYCALAGLLGLRTSADLSRIAERLFDPDATVRRIAQAVVEKHRDTPRFSIVVDAVRHRLKSEARGERRAALQVASALTLAEVCDDICGLIEGDMAIASLAHGALVQICHQDFGGSAWQWRGWLDAHRGKPRVEWLLEGMAHEQQAIRAAAARELERMTFQSYGFSAVAPPAQRAAAIHRWRTWWMRTGRTQFGRR